MKLGYGGTKEEMERLLADAEKLSGQEYDISSYADIVDAIHVVQTEMGITGTTAKEAATTIQGSTASMKSAWANLVTGLADDSADFDTLMSNFVDSAVTVGENIIPRIQTTIQGVTQLVSAASKTIVPLIVDTLMQNLPKLIEGGVRLIIALAGGLIKAIPQLVKNIPAIIAAIVKGLAAGTSQILEVGKNIVRGIWNGISAMGGWIREKVTGFFNGIVNGVKGILGIHSPSKVFASIGENMALGLGEGWNGEFDAVKKSVNGDMDFAGSYTPSIATAKANRASSTSAQNNTDALLTAILNKLDGMGVYIDGTTLTGYVDNQLGSMATSNSRLALA